MKLAIVNLTNGGLSGGYRKYLIELLPHLSINPAIDDLTVVVPHGIRLADLEGARVVTMAPSAHLRAFADVVDEVLKSKPDIVFIPTARWKRFGDVPVVSMVRNMEPLIVPFEGNGPIERVRNLGRAKAAKVAARRSARVIAVSQAVRDHIVPRWKLDLQRIAVVHHGVSPPALTKTASAPTNKLVKLEGHHFFFTAGSIRPARGLEDAIRALGTLTRKGITAELAVAGYVDWDSRFGRSLRRLVEEERVGSLIAWLGQLCSQEMSWCFNNCVAFVTTSRAEACPNTLLEAMRHGSPCIATNLAVMFEFLGPQALAYPPGDWAGLSSLLEKTLTLNPNVASAYSEDLRLRSQAFTWERTANRTVTELETAQTSQMVTAPEIQR